MGSAPDWRQGLRRQQVPARDALAPRGLLHDLGHELTTLSYLVEAVREDASLAEDSAYRLELLSLELSRLLGMIAREMGDIADVRLPGGAGPVDLRLLASQVAEIARFTQEASVELLPGPRVLVQLSPDLLWRVLSNVVGNAVRAAGPGGRVVLGIARSDVAVIEVTDDGPGFGKAPRGSAGLGMRVAASLLRSCGGGLEVASPEAGGTRVRIMLPERAMAGAAWTPAPTGE